MKKVGELEGEDLVVLEPGEKEWIEARSAVLDTLGVLRENVVAIAAQRLVVIDDMTRKERERRAAAGHPELPLGGG